MYVKEMHIEVNLSLQKIAANKIRKFYSQEIDWLLNKNQERYIHSLMKPRKDGGGGFEIDQQGLDGIRTLVKARVPLNVFKQDSKRYTSILPGDYSHLVADASQIKKVCANTVTTSVVTENLLVIPIKKSVKVAAPFYAIFKITIDGVEQFNIIDYTVARNVSYTGYDSTEEIYEIVPTMVKALIDKGYNAHWERYGNKYFPRSLILVSGGIPSGVATIDASNYSGVIHAYSNQVDDIEGVETTNVGNALTASNLLPTLETVAFFKTSPEEPLSEVAGAFLSVYADETFIVSKTLISYVRKPQRISLILGHDSELAPEYHQIICDRTVEYIKGMIADPNWEVKLKDNITRTPS